MREAILDEIETIELQLGDRHKKHEDGRPWTAEEFEVWRVGALSARRARVKVLRKLNRWLYRVDP